MGFDVRAAVGVVVRLRGSGRCSAPGFDGVSVEPVVEVVPQVVVAGPEVPHVANGFGVSVSWGERVPADRGAGVKVGHFGDCGVGRDEVVAGIGPHAGRRDAVVPMLGDVGPEEGLGVAVALATSGPVFGHACREWFAHADEVVRCIAERPGGGGQEGLDEESAFGLIVGAHEVNAAG